MGNIKILAWTIITLLYDNASLQFSNLCWIVISQLGTIIFGFLMFQQKLDIHDWVATILLFASAVVAFTK